MSFYNEGKEPQQIVNDVLIGHDGYLFLFQGAQRQFDFLLGVKSPTRESVSNFYNNIDSRNKYCNENGFSYRHIVFPSKPIIKQRYLPREYSSVESLFEKIYEPIFGGAHENILLYPKNFLLALEDKSISTFKLLDTHNTELGRFYLSNYILDSIGVKTNLNFDCETVRVNGDLALMLKCERVWEEDFSLKHSVDNIRFGNRDELPSNTNEIVISQSVCSNNLKRLLIFGDSFFKDLIRFFEPYFSSIMYVRSPFFHKDIANYFLPDVVLTGNAERYLSHVASDCSANNFIFELYGKPNYKPGESYLEALRAELSFSYYPHIYQKYKEKLFEKRAYRTGRIENVTANFVSGWCIDGSKDIPEVDVFINGEYFKTVACDSKRNDVSYKYKNNNKYTGFKIDVNLNVDDVVDCNISGSDVALERIRIKA